MYLRGPIKSGQFLLSMADQSMINPSSFESAGREPGTRAGHPQVPAMDDISRAVLRPFSANP